MSTHSSLAQSVEHAAVNRRVVCSSQTGGAKNRRHGAPCLLFFSFLCMIPTDDPVFPLLHSAVICFAAAVAAGGSKHRRCEDRRNRERWRQRRTARPCFKEMGRLFEPDRSSQKSRSRMWAGFLLLTSYLFTLTSTKVFHGIFGK